MTQRLTAWKARVVFVNIISCVLALNSIKIKITLNIYKNKNKYKK